MVVEVDWTRLDFVLTRQVGRVNDARQGHVMDVPGVSHEGFMRFVHGSLLTSMVSAATPQETRTKSRSRGQPKHACIPRTKSVRRSINLSYEELDREEPIRAGRCLRGTHRVRGVFVFVCLTDDSSGSGPHLGFPVAKVECSTPERGRPHML